MINDGVFQVGCASCQYEQLLETGPANASYVVCNYAGYPGGSKLYELGVPTSSCTKGKNFLYPNLCSTEENKIVQWVFIWKSNNK